MKLLPKERWERGRQKRKQVRRTDHAVWSPEKRQANTLELMRASMRGRVPSLIELKYARMAASPFGYFRGAVPVMAYDLSRLSNTGIESQLCGDAHVRNLGAFAGPDGRMVFDINDFDETIRGPFEWDVKRMATSLMLAGRGTGEKEPYCRDAARVFVERYREMMLEFARMPVLDMARYQVHRLKSTVSVGGLLQMAERATPIHTLQQLTEVQKQRIGRSQGEKKRVFKSEPPVLTRLSGAAAKKVIASLKTYEKSIQPQRRRFLEQYRPQDVAFKVVGTGSVGMRDYCIYMEGNGAKDPLFLQIKEETVSAYAPYLAKDRNAPRHQGQRVVEGEIAMQLQSDTFLGWTTLEGRDYLVRQLNDHKASIQVEDLRDTELLEYAEVCGEMLARGHARSGDCEELAGYLGGSQRFDDAVVQFAVAYADQTEKDWKELVGWMKKKPTNARTKSARKRTSRKR
ncbi:DUF2252 domain-containing protein [Edaphobacter albus]|uniref:DUF2252 domain-containing protein n=1 Tax=Edaphobacter sp. 4G125 TaxID=2763071 RepID=UPI0016446894|nr:DUF2252 domain-containing protein [Edaphobacter sp. 4G125]QNI36875.1 DUF2252 domain-containing protein [Edaphobacter sp. 4G125]